MSSIQFSYPQMNGTIDSNNKIVLNSPAGSYFDLTYTSGSTITVLHFIPTMISFMDGSTDYIIIYHIGTGGSTLAIRFKIAQSKNAKHEITENNVYINQLIGDGLEAKTVSFNGKSVEIGKDSSTADYTIDFGDIGEIPIKTIKTGLKSTGSFPSYDSIKDSANKDISINLTSNTFITDEIVCNEGITNSTDAATKTYEAKVAGNVGLSFGLGFLVLTAVVFGITKWKPMFNTGTKLFDGWSEHPVYIILLILAFLLSFSCFIGYGGVLTSGSGDKTADLTGLLWTAIVSFLIFVFMVGYKMAVLTKPAAPAAL